MVVRVFVLMEIAEIGGQRSEVGVSGRDET